MAPLEDMPGSETKSVLSAILLADSFAQVCSLRGSGDWLKPVYALHCICQQTVLNLFSKQTPWYLAFCKEPNAGVCAELCTSHTGKAQDASAIGQRAYDGLYP